MDSLIGVVGKDFVMLASDTGMSDNLAMLSTGEPGDVDHFSEYIQRNIALYKMLHQALSPQAAANFTRRQIYQSLRSGEGLKLVNMLIAGYDQHRKRGQLFSLDYLGGMNEAPYAFEGFCQYFGLAIGDRLWHPNMEEPEVHGLIIKVIHEISNRMAFNKNIYPPKTLIERPLNFVINTAPALALSKDENISS
ncbi:hypothetical protein GJ496_010407 [Pomphorhynchus laevis]|nr:hypothetical protein GJ496_010407 [Pomphorhynchus laevis]